MKVNKIIAAGVLSAVMGTSVFAQTVINVTGATAFRAASHAAILNSLDNAEFAWVGNQQLSGANRAIFKGRINGEEYIIRTSWSGSGDGVAALLDQSPVEVLALNTPVSTAGVFVENPAFEGGLAKFSFSDVAQSATTRPTPALEATPAGVVPFMFVASKAAADYGFTNVTSQQFDALYRLGGSPLSLFTGNDEHMDVVVFPTGRASSSGTRITVLAETGYGINSGLSQFSFDGSGPISYAEVVPFASGAGYSSNSFIRDIVQRDSEEGGPVVFGYLTVSDAQAAIAGGAQELSYNGVNYSVENVTSGKYTLWGYQQFFNVDGLNAAEETFKSTLINTLPDSLGSAGITIPEMNVTRIDGEGGTVLPN